MYSCCEDAAFLSRSCVKWCSWIYLSKTGFRIHWNIYISYQLRVYKSWWKLLSRFSQFLVNLLQEWRWRRCCLELFQGWRGNLVVESWLSHKTWLYNGSLVYRNYSFWYFLVWITPRNLIFRSFGPWSKSYKFLEGCSWLFLWWFWRHFQLEWERSKILYFLKIRLDLFIEMNITKSFMIFYLQKKCQPLTKRIRIFYRLFKTTWKKTNLL